MPSPPPDAPGFILRDPFRYAQEILLIPPIWARALALLDGKQTEADIQALLTRLTGGVFVRGEDVRRFIDALRHRGFLDSPETEQLRNTRHEEFRRASQRLPSHAGAAYPAQPQELSRQLREEFHVVPAAVPALDGEAPRLLGVAAPHVSPSGGVESYGAAYRRLAADLQDRTFGCGQRPRNYTWAELMRRVFAIDVLECPRCLGRMRIVAAIHSPAAIRAILECLGLPSRAPPISPAMRDAQDFLN